MPRRIDPAKIAEIAGASSPPPLDDKIKARTRRHLGVPPARLLIIASRNPADVRLYADRDLVAATRAGKAWLTHRDGTPYPQTLND